MKSYFSNNVSTGKGDFCLCSPIFLDDVIDDIIFLINISC